MIFKICCLGLKGYLRDGFNIFDGILVIVSLFDVVMELIMGAGTGASVLAVFRTLRLLRVLKLAAKSKGLLILLTVKNFLQYSNSYLGYHEYPYGYRVFYTPLSFVHIYLCFVGNGSIFL